MDTLTVRQLIAELQKIDPEQHDLPVLLEGCDCYQVANAVGVFPAERHTMEGVPEGSDYVLVGRI